MTDGERLKIIYSALRERGYAPVNQIVGFILSGDPTYITNHNGARSLALSLIHISQDPIARRASILENFFALYNRDDRPNPCLLYTSIVVHIEGEKNGVPKHLKRVFRAVVLLQFSDHCAQIDRDHIPPDEELVLLRDLELCQPAAHSIALFGRPAVVIIDDVLHPDILPGDFGIFVLNILEKGHTAQGLSLIHICTLSRWKVSFLTSTKHPLASLRMI